MLANARFRAAYRVPARRGAVVRLVVPALARRAMALGGLPRLVRLTATTSDGATVTRSARLSRRRAPGG